MQNNAQNDLNEVDALFGLTAYHQFSCGCVLVKTRTEMKQEEGCGEMRGKFAYCEYHGKQK